MGGSGYAIVYLVIYGTFALFVGVSLWLGWFLFVQGYKRAGIAIYAALFVAGTVPAALSHWETSQIGRSVADLSFAPDSIDFAGKRVVFVESASTICERYVCGYALRHGGLSEVYWAAANNLSYHYPDSAWPFDAVKQQAEFYKMGLTDPADSGGVILPDPVEKSDQLPVVDYTVLVDDSFVTLEYANAFDLPQDLARKVRFSYMVFEGWPKPGQAPIARLMTAQYTVEPYFIWPVSSRHAYDPPLSTHENEVRGWFCADPMDSPYFAAEQCTK